jgi:tetratricopeptide (TPR) repeat protein
MDSMMLQSIASSAWEMTAETRRARQSMENVGHAVEDVADQIQALERELGMQLEEQTAVLRQHTEVLGAIHDTLLTPAKTRAAERVADAAQLLDRERWERALMVAEEGIEADPNNPGVFEAAGWALLSMDRLDEARQMFEEARDASDGDARSRAARQAARAALAGDHAALAYKLGRDARALAVSADERAAVDYDVAVYALLNGDGDIAADSLEAACRHDSRYSEMAVMDRHFDAAPDLRDRAARILTEFAQAVQRRQPEVTAHSARVRATWPRAPQTSKTYAQLGAGVRPNHDWGALQVELSTELGGAERKLAEATDEPSLQHTLRVLGEADAELAAVESRTTHLVELIAAHEAAAYQHERLEAQLGEAERAAQNWRQVLNLTGAARRRFRQLLFWGLVAFAVGLLIPPVIVVAVGLLLYSIVGSIVNGAAQNGFNQHQAEVTNLRSQLAAAI